MIVIIIIIRHQLDLDRPVVTSFNSLFKGLPSRLRPFRLQFSISFAVLLLFVIVTCRGRFHLYLLSFWSTGSTFKLFQNFFIPFVVKNGVLGCSAEKFRYIN
jgi:hypothetical protein